jgi:hypothetical protein
VLVNSKDAPDTDPCTSSAVQSLHHHLRRLLLLLLLLLLFVFFMRILTGRGSGVGQQQGGA